MIAPGSKVFLWAIANVIREPEKGWNETPPDSKPTLVAV